MRQALALLRRPLALLIVGGTLVFGGCTLVGGPIARFMTLDGLGSAAPTSSPDVPNPAPEVSLGGEATSGPTPRSAAHAGVTGHITAGPTCPVETEPPTPGCAPRPVAGATVIATDATGHEVARAVSDSGGWYALELAPGTYTLTPDQWTLRMRTSPARTVTVGADALGNVTVDFTYDTGIR